MLDAFLRRPDVRSRAGIDREKRIFRIETRSQAPREVQDHLRVLLANQTHRLLARARRVQHMFGGAMREAGIAGAGCLYALDHHVERLEEDHRNAQRLAAGLAAIEGIVARNPQPETNMVSFAPAGVGISNATFLAALLRHGVRMGEVQGQIRAVTHLDVTSADIEVAIKAVADIARNPPAEEPAATTAKVGY